MLLLTGPGPAQPPPETTASEPACKKLLLSTDAVPASDVQLRRRRRVAMLLKEQLLTAIVDRKLTIRGLFPAAVADDSLAARPPHLEAKQSSSRSPTKEQRVDSAQLGAALRRLGLAASDDEVDELLLDAHGRGRAMVVFMSMSVSRAFKAPYQVLKGLIRP